jgi:hypothetical protein
MAKKIYARFSVKVVEFEGKLASPIASRIRLFGKM